MLKVQDENDGQTVPTLSDVKTLTVEEFMAKFPNSTLNEGCLEDVACSNCGNREMFRVFVRQPGTYLQMLNSQHCQLQWVEMAMH